MKQKTMTIKYDTTPTGDFSNLTMILRKNGVRPANIAQACENIAKNMRWLEQNEIQEVIKCTQ